MPRNDRIKKVLVIGSGPIIIGQAAEFDYAGTQACRSLKEEGLTVVLVNSNPATIMTDKDIADIVYIEPLTVQVLKKIILKENPSKIDPFDCFVDIIYEDEDVAIINKNAGIAVIATNAHYGKSLMNALANVWGDFVFHPVNRLDKGTSGVMIVAKNALSHSILSARIAEDKKMCKENILHWCITLAIF